MQHYTDLSTGKWGVAEKPPTNVEEALKLGHEQRLEEFGGTPQKSLEETAAGNMNVKGASGEISKGNEEYVIGNQKVIFVIKQEKT